MRKILIYILAIIFICIIIPVICTKKFKTNQTIAEAEKQMEIVEKYDYSQISTIKLLHTKTNEIEEVSLDEYICNVIAAEMPINFEMEALKAQSVVARTYTVYKISKDNSKHENADICDSASCCQAWISKEDRYAKWNPDEADDNWNKIVKVVNETIGQIITYNGEAINAVFHSNSGGKTEIASNVWSGGDYPYLQSVETTGEETYTQYESEVILTKNQLKEKLLASYKDFSINFDEEDAIKVLEYTDSGRVKTIKLGNKNIARSGTPNLNRIKISKF